VNYLLSILLALGVLGSGLRTAAGAVPPATSASNSVQPARMLTACQLEDPSKVATVAAECGDFSVPEDPSAPGGRFIRLRVARVAAINRHKQPDPLFVLAGGPGMAATKFYASVGVAFERIHRDRDIVLVDQRGTGDSNALTCELDDDVLYRAPEGAVVEVSRRCLRSLQKSARVEFYTTSVAVGDLDSVRVALGYERINLYGASYGTRVAQHYLRRFPAHTRSLILDGVVPPQLALGPSISLNAEQALARIFERCAKDEQCHKQFGDPSAFYHMLRDSLKAHPVPVSLPDPTSGQPYKLDFMSYHLATVLRLASYTAEQAALLPLMVHDATVHANFTPLASQFLLVNRSYADVVAYGMHNAVVCSEDVPFWDLTKVNRSELEKTYLGTTPIDGLRAVCADWPRGPVDADFHSPLQTDTPVLLLSGSDDPVTPPADAELARQGLTHSMHLVLQGFGHGQLVAPCVDRVMAKFIELGRVEGLDVSCVRNDRPLPFFVTLGGPAP
jgi:pimeloyl-ACP methyl ester carboxylesterase